MSKRRLLAALASGFPLWFIGAGAATALTTPTPIVIVGLYCLYLLKRARYSWGDYLLYGAQMESDLRPRIQALRPEVATNIFPLSVPHTILRLACYAVTTFLLMLLVASITQSQRSGGVQRRSDPDLPANPQLDDLTQQIVTLACSEQKTQAQELFLRIQNFGHILIRTDDLF